MNRRNAIQSLGLVTTHALFPSILSGFIVSCTNRKEDQNELTNYEPTFFSESEFETLKEVIDLIIPATQTASASEVNTHHFLDEVFAKCLTKDQQELIKEGFSAFANEFNASNDKSALLAEIDQKAFANDDDYAWFIPIKQYTLVGFFTSQEGETKASNYVPVPGDYKGDIPLDDSTLNYGLTSLRYYL